MEKYQKMLIGFMIGLLSIAVLYILIVVIKSGTGGSGSEDSNFPFFIFFPSWIAIFVPIIARQREEDKKREEDLQRGVKKNGM